MVGIGWRGGWERNFLFGVCIGRENRTFVKVQNRLWYLFEARENALLRADACGEGCRSLRQDNKAKVEGGGGGGRVDGSIKSIVSPSPNKKTARGDTTHYILSLCLSVLSVNVELGSGLG
jgi:hypothetical protein